MKPTAPGIRKEIGTQSRECSSSTIYPIRLTSPARLGGIALGILSVGGIALGALAIGGGVLGREAIEAILLGG